MQLKASKDEELDRRIRATSLLEQLEGKPSTKSVLEASSGRERSALPLLNPWFLSFIAAPESIPPILAICESSRNRVETPPILATCESSPNRLEIPPSMLLVDCATP